MTDEQFKDWLRGLSALPIVEAAVQELPTALEAQTEILMTCQLILWQAEAAGQDTAADLKVLAQLRDRLLG